MLSKNIGQQITIFAPYLCLTTTHWYLPERKPRGNYEAKTYSWYTKDNENFPLKYYSLIFSFNKEEEWAIPGFWANFARLYVITRIPEDLNKMNSNQQNNMQWNKSKAWLTFIFDRKKKKDCPSSHSFIQNWLSPRSNPNLVLWIPRAVITFLYITAHQWHGSSSHVLPTQSAKT